MSDVEIEQGPELDRAVAEAIGFTWPVVEGPPRRAVGLYEVVPDDAVEVSPCDPLFPKDAIRKYSTDLNAAFAAAWKAGLFDAWMLRHDGGEWSFQDWYEAELYTNDTDYETVRAETPALAICAAILKLKEQA